ncbi:tyrosine-type recombinase/integrase [Brassicibacter mesophilus]|uniref:tyrosine-type recombinase/integrase n=1 Tax=Brassicibacter mesophilus TaxID=745119 RepID=UPI003D23805A
MNINYKKKINGLCFVDTVFNDDEETKIGSLIFDSKCQIVPEAFDYIMYLTKNETSNFNSINRRTRDILFLYDFLVVANIKIYNLNDSAIDEIIQFLKIVKVKKESEYDNFKKNKYAIERTLFKHLELVSHYKNSKIRTYSDNITNLAHNSIYRIMTNIISFLKFLTKKNGQVPYFDNNKLPTDRQVRKKLQINGIYVEKFKIETVDIDMIFSDEELDRLSFEMSGCKGYLRLFTFLLEKTGMRPGEALGIQIVNFDVNNIKNIKGDIVHRKGRWEIKIIFRPGNPTDSLAKSHSNRIIELKHEENYLFEMLLDRYLKWRKSILKGKKLKWLFISNRGNKLSQNTAYKRFKEKIRKCDPILSNNLTLHSFRHTFCTKEMTKGIPIEFIAKMVGHSSPRVTFETYIHLCGLSEQEIVDRYSTYIKTGERKYGYKQ